MVRRAVGIIAVALLVKSLGLDAQQRFEIAGIAGYQFGGRLNGSTYSVGDDFFTDDLKVSNAFTAGLIFDYSISENIQIEALVQRQSTNIFAESTDEKVLDTKIDYYHAGFLFKIPSRWNPFAAITGGATRFIPDEDRENEWRGSLGVALGVKTFFNYTWGVRVESRIMGTYIKDNDSIYCGPGGDNCYSYPSTVFMNQIDLVAGVVARF
jgi:hypothetical protein